MFVAGRKCMYVPLWLDVARRSRGGCWGRGGVDVVLGMVVLAGL